MLEHLNQAIKIGDTDKVIYFTETKRQSPQVLGNALFKAIECQRIFMGELLIKNGANLNIFDEFGYSPLMRAIKINVDFTRGCFMTMIMNGKANINLQNKYGWTALMIAACEQKSVLPLKELIKVGADISLSDKLEETAFHKACIVGNLEGAKVLVQAGADMLKKNKEGKDAYNLAMENGHHEVAKMIKEAIKEQLKAKKIASHQGNNQALSLLIEKGVSYAK
ncbi:MAG: ankyrin repeat domain-containing protein [Alphaproteobacteria bacterium]|nr:ankyrin repeat domain-containing protein [Alphaproteobacteria bacterium]